MRNAVIGMGSLGIATTISFAQRHGVCAVDSDPIRVRPIRDLSSQIADLEVAHFLATKNVTLSAAIESLEALLGNDVTVIAAPSNYDNDTQSISASTPESKLATVAQHAPDATAVTRSSIPSFGPGKGDLCSDPPAGFSGYCLPKVTKQPLLANSRQEPPSYSAAAIVSDNTREHFMAFDLIAQNLGVVGGYRLVYEQLQRSMLLCGIRKIPACCGMVLDNRSSSGLVTVVERFASVPFSVLTSDTLDPIPPARYFQPDAVFMVHRWIKQLPTPFGKEYQLV